jgi:transposase
MTRLTAESAESGVHRGKIFVAIELSKAKWVVALRVPHLDKVSLFEIAGGDAERLLGLLDRARAAVAAQGCDAPEIYTCYEAGYDGFWLHRLLVSRGIRNSVLDSASIQVSRRRRRLKTDRTDAESLIRVFMAWHRGERQACSVVRVPSPEEEDMKRLHRSRANLLRERVRHVNRIRGLLHLQGVVHIHPHREGWTSGLKDLQTRDGRRFPEQLMSEIKREAKLLEIVKKLLREVDLELIALVRTQRSRRRSPAREAAHPIASKLVRIRGIGPTVAAVLATELFYRRFDNRRQVASYIGLAPTPYSSGATSRDQGISKAGNNRARHNAIELAWLWLRHQPESRLTAWYRDRVTNAQGRVRRIAIVALARKLIVALWRFIETGLIPEGMVLKA